MKTRELVTLDMLEERIPEIPWRRPILISTTEGDAGLACRVCIAAVGVHGSEVASLPKTFEGHAEHFRLAHGAEAERP